MCSTDREEQIEEQGIRIQAATAVYAVENGGGDVGGDSDVVALP